MDRMREPLRCFKDIVEADLRRGARLIIKVQNEIDPQWRIASPEGDWHIAMQLPSELNGRNNLFRIVRNFMIWKQALSFVNVSELKVDPECIAAVGVSMNEIHSCISVVDHSTWPYTKASFSEIQWLPRSAIGDEIVDLLPRGVAELSHEDVAELKNWFAAGGREPAINLDSKTVGA